MNETIKNIKEMAPKLNSDQQHVILGMLIGMLTGRKPESTKPSDPEQKGA